VNLLGAFSYVVFMASINCKDIGFDCSFVAQGATELDAIRQFIEHIESTHKIPVLTSDVIFRLKNGIKK
jgi:predicted small metal-binding protein